MQAPTLKDIKDRAEVSSRFDSFTLDADQLTAMKSNRTQFAAVADEIVANIAPSRERSLALTALEEAKYWSNQAIARNGISDVDWDAEPAAGPQS